MAFMKRKGGIFEKKKSLIYFEKKMRRFLLREFSTAKKSQDLKNINPGFLLSFPFL